ncbi:unnamed protein product [Peronospora belbahrii]|uniref:Uncharacterized protein n=1 Tax=Peronospora belbahrii TaxID=622444 RepID=A0ABN8CRY6_9STRA|nr:unnamed protein product [Peronospora belbahrii]
MRRLHGWLTQWRVRNVDVIYVEQADPKVGICGKYGTRWVHRFDSIKRTVTGIWQCRSCYKTIAGGAYLLNTASAATVRSTLARLRKIRDDASA